MFIDEEVFGIMDYAFSTPFVRDRLRDILDATHGCPRGGNPIADKISNSFERRRTAFIQPKVRVNPEFCVNCKT